MDEEEEEEEMRRKEKEKKWNLFWILFELITRQAVFKKNKLWRSCRREKTLFMCTIIFKWRLLGLEWELRGLG